MAAKVAEQAGNWDAEATWGEAAPVAGDTVDLATFDVVMNVPTIPVGGGALTLLKASGIGTLTVALGDEAKAINVTTMETGTDHLILVADATANVLTITATGGTITGGAAAWKAAIRHNGTGTINVVCPTVNGGSQSSAPGIWNNSTGTVTLTGDSEGGTHTATHGILNNSSGTVTVTGNVTAGSATGAMGIRHANSSGTVTINAGNLIDSATASAVGGKYVWNPGPTNYHSIQTGGGAVKCRPGAGALVGPSALISA